MKTYWSVHNHSRYSVNDALSQVPALATRAEELGYPALGLTDHGAVGGIIELYRECRARGLEPLPGTELYITPDREHRVQGHNLHLTVNAYSERGYRNLCKLITRTAENFHYKPRIDFADLAEMADSGLTTGLMVSTGCWFGVLPTLVREQGPAAAAHMAKTLAGWFPRVYVELQAHGIEQEEYGEDAMVAALVQIANEVGLPHIITSDAHYVCGEDRYLHDALKRICSWSDDPDDAQFPGDPYALHATTDLENYFEPVVLEHSLDALADLAEVASVRIPEIENFRSLVPDVCPGKDPGEELRRLVKEGIERKVGNLSPKAQQRYYERADEELDVVDATGAHGLLLLVAWVCGEMRQRKIVFNTRGSANDFLLNWLLGITMVDSVKWGLRPERFMSKDRTKLPDIDLDVEHARREEVTDLLSENFTTCQVGTIMKYSLIAAEGEAEDSSKGSLRVRYFATARKAGRLVAGGNDEWRGIPDGDKKVLWELSDRKLISGYGTHPAGWIVAPDPAAIADLPMVRIGSGTGAHLVTAYGKNDVEDLGFVKLDLLGLRTMTAARIACELVMADPHYDGEQYESPEDFLEAIPLTDEKVYNRISRGRTDGMFQLEGWTQTKGLQRLRPTKIRDIIVAQALFRPAAMNSNTTAEYLGRRKGVYDVPKLHPDLQAETAGTYGLLLYQEQVIGALRRIGMDVAELNKLLKAVKASNEYVSDAKKAIDAALPRIHQLAAAKGWSDFDVNVLAEAVVGYADYGFNEAHAVAYGLLAYRTGWLAENWPLPWWAGVLTAYTNHDKERPYVRVAKANGVKIFPAHVNRSGVTYTAVPERGGIRKGLLSIPGVGPVAATEIAANAPYESLVEFGQKVLPRRVSGAKALAVGGKPSEVGGLVAKLDEVGALDGLS